MQHQLFVKNLVRNTFYNRSEPTFHRHLFSEHRQNFVKISYVLLGVAFSMSHSIYGSIGIVFNNAPSYVWYCDFNLL